MPIGFRFRLRGKRADRNARLAIAALLAASEMAVYAWYTIDDRWGYYALPFPLCTMTLWTGENFMFLARKPDTPSMLDLLAPWPWYILQLEWIALALCFLLFDPYGCWISRSAKGRY